MPRRSLVCCVLAAQIGCLLLVGGCSSTPDPKLLADEPLDKSLLADVKMLTKQVAEIQRSLAKVTGDKSAAPAEESPDIERELAEIEKQLANPAKLPAPTESGRLRQQLARLANLIGHDDDPLVNRLECAAWVLDAATAFANQSGAPTTSDDRANLLQRLRESKPNTPGPLAVSVSKFEADLAATLAAIEKQELDELWKTAEAARKLTLANQEEVDQITAALDHVQVILSRTKDDKSQLDKAKVLKDQLQQKVRLKGAEEKVRLLESTWARVKDIKDPLLKQPYLSHVHSAAVGLLMDLELDGDVVAGPKARALTVVKGCETGVQQIVQEQRLAAEQKLRNYQKMALGEIDQFSKWRNDKALEVIRADVLAFATAVRPQKWDLLNEFPELRTFVKEVLGVAIVVVPMRAVELNVDQQRAIYDGLKGTVNGLNYKATDMAYATEREAFKRHLLPIRADLLDLPVAELYHKAFQESWKALEGREDQLLIAKAAAVVVKRGIE